MGGSGVLVLGNQSLRNARNDDLSPALCPLHSSTPGQASRMDTKCNPVAIAILRVAITAYEDAMGPLVKARAKSKCAAHATFS